MNIYQKAAEVIQHAGEAYFGVIDESGYPSVSTVSSIKTEGLLKTWYSGGASGNKAKRLARCEKASVCYHVGGDNVTLVGTARVLTDPEIKHALWQDGFIDHFTEGKDDPEYIVIEFTAQRVSLWVDNESAECSVKDIPVA